MKRTAAKSLFTLLLIFILSCLSGQAQTTVTIDPGDKQQIVAGWGASLCWWAHMVGQWDDEDKIDEIIGLITSPDQLNMNIFRYNIGGGDDPAHYSTPSSPGHMAEGKGVRAEMEGFKASADSPYNWGADAGQRKIMLKIRERRPDAIFEAFSNSPPYWMTYSGCSAGNVNPSEDNLKPEYYEQFAAYLTDVCRFYKDSFDLEFKTLEPFNESLTNYWGYMGSQEGCHFDLSSQIAFIKTLYPVLRKSGLNTVISATDETNLRIFLTELEGYIEDGEVMEMTGQLNTHTYGGSDEERKEVNRIVSGLNKTLWQSETGPSGFRTTGLANNLQLAQKLFADMKIMKPVAWLDWQLFEEHNDTWCQLRGSFEDETYAVVKNFYVRMQVTRFIKQGYTIVSADNEDVMAATDPDGSELVIVAINNSDSPKDFIFDISRAYLSSYPAAVFRTSKDEDCAEAENLAIKENSLEYTAPARSITTIITETRKMRGAVL